jgi:hypothetical protein|tara:strand:- start:1324 stop:1488 length:165 start_codon:yes stop_codon:yes gene_type:complete
MKDFLITVKKMFSLELEWHFSTDQGTVNTNFEHQTKNKGFAVKGLINTLQKDEK